MRLSAIKSKRPAITWLLAVSGFSLAAFLVRWAGLTIPVVGTQANVDPRELFIILGAAMTGPVGGAVIGFFADLSTLPIGLSSMIAHIVGGFLFGLLYRPIYNRLRMPALLVGWSGLVVAYYNFFITPAFITALWFGKTVTISTVFGQDLSFFQAYTIIVQGNLPELVANLFVTAIVFIALPEKYRRPLWAWPLGQNVGRPQKTAARVRSAPTFISPLALRLALWFILLSLLPLLVLLIFVRQNAQTVIKNLDIQHQYELTVLLAEQTAAPDNVDAIRPLPAPLADNGLTIFIVNDDGVSPAHLNGADVDTLPAEVLNTILSRRDGFYTEPSGANTFTFTPLPDQASVLVVASGLARTNRSLTELVSGSALQLLVTALVMFISSGIVIWLLVGLPVRELTSAAEQISAGHLTTRVNPDNMIDDLAVLGATFNTMTTRLGDSIETLEQRVAARTEELAAFFDLTMLPGQQPDETGLLRDALSRVVKTGDFAAVAIHRFEADQTALALVAHHGLPAATVQQWQTAATQTSLAAWAGGLTQPVVANQPEAVAALPAALRVEGLASYAGAPFSLHGQSHGLLSVFHQANRRFSLDEISLLTALARQMGLLIENSHSQQQVSQIAMLEERQRLARDLHDVVSQTLFSASIMAESLPDLWEKAPQDVPPLLHKLHHLNRGALAEMRSLLLELRPKALEKTGLDVLLKQLGYAAVGTTHLELILELQPDAGLPPEIKINLYRMAQEAINNVVKHARATALVISLRFEPPPAARVILHISDDGRGFAPARVEPGRMGLHILQERAAAIGARLTVESQPGRGTSVLVECPLG